MLNSAIVWKEEEENCLPPCLLPSDYIMSPSNLPTFDSGSTLLPPLLLWAYRLELNSELPRDKQIWIIDLIPRSYKLKAKK